SVASLTNHASYPHAPTTTNWITDLFEVPVNVGDDYGQRVRGYVIPPVSGYYTFWISSDDQSELWLSTNAAPSTNYSRIARVLSWTNPREWTKETNQQSAPILLAAGQLYAFYALMKEGAGGDNLAVRWRLPDGTIQEPMPAAHLAPPGGPFEAPQVVAQSATNVVADENSAVTFSVTVSNLYPVGYQWRRNGSDITTATAPAYALDPVAMTNHGDFFDCLITNALGSVTSAPVQVTVTADTNRPAVFSLFNYGTVLLYGEFSEPVTPASGGNLTNYSINNGASLYDANLDLNGRSFTLFVTNLTTGATYTVTISNIIDRAVASNSILPGTEWTFVARPFSPIPIGGLIQAPDLSYTTNGVDITSRGLGFSLTNDQGELNYASRTGDFDVAVMLAGLDFSDAWAEAGIMARAAPDMYADFSAALATPTINGAFFAYRRFSLLANPGFERGQGIGLNPADWDGSWYTAHALTNRTIIGGTHTAPTSARTGTWMLLVTNNVDDTAANWHGTGQYFP
ncbi:MAG TPA: PA14 domain-containing protein, partial [Kiritimatiellia bacterium]